jgi:hypothetical protein
MAQQEMDRLVVQIREKVEMQKFVSRSTVAMIAKTEEATLGGERKTIAAMFTSGTEYFAYTGPATTPAERFPDGDDLSPSGRGKRGLQDPEDLVEGSEGQVALHHGEQSRTGSVDKGIPDGRRSRSGTSSVLIKAFSWTVNGWRRSEDTRRVPSSRGVRRFLYPLRGG